MNKQSKKINFNGQELLGAVIAVILIFLLIFGSINLEKLTNAPQS